MAASDSSSVDPSSPLVVVTLFMTAVLCMTMAFGPRPSVPPVPPQDEAAVAAGRAVFTRYCALCHGENAEGHAADYAPALNNDELLRIASDAYLTETIAGGRFGTPMAAFGRASGGPLDDADIANVIAFMRSHQRSPSLALSAAPIVGDPRRGGGLYRQHCIECHAIEGIETKGPRLDHPAFLGAVSDAFIEHSVRFGRPGTPMKAWGEELSDRDIRDIVAAIRRLENRGDRLRADDGHSHDHDHDHAHGRDPHERPPVPPEVRERDRPVLDLWETVEDGALAIGEPGAPGPAFSLTGRWYVSASQLNDAVRAGQRMVILDARAMSDWLGGHLPGALPVPYYSDEETLDRIPDDGTWVVVYCGCPHAAADRVAGRLRDRGVESIAVLDEGFWHWKEQEYQVVVGAERGAPER